MFDTYLTSEEWNKVKEYELLHNKSNKKTKNSLEEKPKKQKNPFNLKEKELKDMIKNIIEGEMIVEEKPKKHKKIKKNYSNYEDPSEYPEDFKKYL